MSLLFEINTGRDGNSYTILEYLEKIKTPSYFYVAKSLKGSDTLTWQQVISLTSGAIIDEVTFSQDSLKIMDTFDLKGLEVRST